MEIHPTAIVSPKAELAQDVRIHAFSVIGPKVTIGAGCEIGPHAVIDGLTTIGERNRIFPFSSIGLSPQDISYQNEETRLIIGDDNVIRENVTIHRGSHRGDGATILGSQTYIMAYVHIAHDCRIGNRVIMANVATLGGHVHVGDCATIGGLVAVHQFVRVGMYSFVGGKAAVRMDIPPYMLAVGAAAAKLYGPNIIGLKRNGFPAEAIQALKKSYRILFRSGLILKDATERVRREVQMCPEVEHLLEFMSGVSKRGITR